MNKEPMTPLEALDDLNGCLQAYYKMGNCPEVSTNLNIIRKALEEYEEMTKKKIVDELLCPVVRNFNYKPVNVDEIVISIDRKKIKEKYPSLRGSWDFSTMLIKYVEDYYEKKHKKI